MFTYKHYINTISLLLSLIAIITVPFLSTTFPADKNIFDGLYIFLFALIVYSFNDLDNITAKSIILAALMLATLICLGCLLLPKADININDLIYLCIFLVLLLIIPVNHIKERILRIVLLASLAFPFLILEKPLLNFSIYFVLIYIIYLTQKYLDVLNKDIFSTLFCFVIVFFSLWSSLGIIISSMICLYLYKTYKLKIYQIIILIVAGTFIMLLSKLGNLHSIDFYLAGLPLAAFILLFLLALYISWISSDAQELYFALGIIVFIADLILIILGNHHYLFESSPFFLIAIKDYKVDLYRGKILSI